MSAPEFPPGISPPEDPETGQNGHVPASDNGAGTSHLDWLRARHEEITADRTVDMDVPGYGGRVVLRFEPIPWRVTPRMQTMLAAKDPDGRALVWANADMMIAACREVLVRDEAGDLAPIDPSGEPCRIEPRLADLLQIDSRSARDTLLWLFPNEFAVTTMGGELMEWTRDAGGEATEAFMGESGPAVK